MSMLPVQCCTCDLDYISKYVYITTDLFMSDIDAIFHFLYLYSIYCMYKYSMYINSRLSAVEADGCQVSRPLRGMQDFIPTACVRNMRTWGGPGTLIWTWAKRGGHAPRGEDLGGA